MSFGHDAKQNFHETSTPLFYAVDCVNINIELQNQNIKPGDYAIGNCVFSDSFGPCQAVVAKLMNGQFAIYHAVVPGEGPLNYTLFINEFLAKNLQSIYVIQKTESSANYNKSSLLISALQASLPDQVELKKVTVGNYTCVVADDTKNCVILAKDVRYISMKNTIEFSDNKSNLVNLIETDSNTDSDWDNDQSQPAELEAESSDSESSEKKVQVGWSSDSESDNEKIEAQWSSDSDSEEEKPAQKREKKSLNFFSSKKTETLLKNNPEKKGPQNTL